MSLRHYYHIYADGQWRGPVSDHIDALKKSGLSENLDYFGVGIVGSLSNRFAVKSYLAEAEVEFSIAVEANLGWEQITLDVIECDDRDKVLYCHTKGAAFPNDHSDQWRRSMTEGVVYRWVRAVDLLENGEADAVGCHWMPFYGGPPRHYSGNFWWARGLYLNRISRPVPVNSRWDAEMWMGSGGGLMYDLSIGAPTSGNWLYEENLGQDGVPEGCIRFIVNNNIINLTKGDIVVRVLDPAVEMCIREGHFQILGKTVEKSYDYRDGRDGE